MKKNKRGSNPWQIIAIIIILGFAFAGYKWFDAEKQLKQMKDQEQQRIASETLTLPPNAVKLSGCVPFMGEHWAVPSDLPFGPIYNVHKNKVVSFEYMFKTSEIPGEVLAKGSPDAMMKYLQENNMTFGDLFRPHFTFNLSNVRYKFANLEWSAPHPSYVEPHFDLHFYLVDKNELSSICPDATPEEAQTPEIEKELDKYNIPYIPMR